MARSLAVHSGVNGSDRDVLPAQPGVREGVGDPNGGRLLVFRASGTLRIASTVKLTGVARFGIAVRLCAQLPVDERVGNQYICGRH